MSMRAHARPCARPRPRSPAGGGRAGCAAQLPVRRLSPLAARNALRLHQNMQAHQHDARPLGGSGAGGHMSGGVLDRHDCALRAGCSGEWGIRASVQARGQGGAGCSGPAGTASPHPPPELANCQSAAHLLPEALGACAGGRDAQLAPTNERLQQDLGLGARRGRRAADAGQS